MANIKNKRNKKVIRRLLGGVLAGLMLSGGMLSAQAGGWRQ